MLPIDSTAMSSSSTFTSAVKDNYLDQNSLNAVKTMGRHNDPQALKEISKKFEGMFVQQMLKSMRDANEVFADGDMFSSQEVKFHQEMLDQQMVLNLTSGQGIGLAKSMYQQMQKMYGKPNTNSDGTLNSVEQSIQDLVPQTKAIPLTPQGFIKPLSSTATGVPALISRAGIKGTMAQTPEEFVAKLKPYAEKAAAALNVNTDVILAQAALETGWGKHLIHDAQGNNSFNIFNIKAGGWQGKNIAVNSLENRDGIAQQERSEFRQYDNYLQSFADYVKLIKNNPRYEQVLAAGNDSAGYADALQKSGYATDPNYADKIKSLLASDAIRSAVSPANQLAMVDPSVNAIANTGVKS